MDSLSLLALLGMAFTVGLVHAFDADHVMAVSVIANQENKWRGVLAYAIKWGFGHGGIILLLGGAFLFLRFHPSTDFFHIAEFSVGMLLCIMGLSVLWTLRSRGLRLVRHSHGDLEHTHLIPASKTGDRSVKWMRHRHTPVFVGSLHGLAGSAALLAILPSLSVGSPLRGFAYLVMFSCACLIGMTLFGVMLAKAQAWLLDKGQRMIDAFRLLLACGSLGLGIFWMIGN